jgi:hypothetical protein
MGMEFSQRDKKGPKSKENILVVGERTRFGKKPVVLLTARVHPGETPASFAMNGTIQFLLNK